MHSRTKLKIHTQHGCKRLVPVGRLAGQKKNDSLFPYTGFRIQGTLRARVPAIPNTPHSLSGLTTIVFAP